MNSSHMDTRDNSKELHRIVTTGIVYNDEGRFLITRRSLEKKRHPGKWTVPGGGLTTDDYENKPKTVGNAWYYVLTDTLKREILEEVGIEIGKPEYLLDLAAGYGDGVPTLILSYYAKYLSGDVKLDEDTIDFKWVSVAELKDYDLIGGIDEEIEMVDKILQKAK